MRAWSFGAAASLLLAVEAIAAPSVVTPPAWRRIPTLDELVAFYPPRAMRMEVEGRATLLCRISTAGRLEDCRVESQAPAEMGFGEAALAMAPLFEASPARRDGQPVETPVIRVPILFKLPTDRRADFDETLRCYGLLTAHLALAPGDQRLAEGVAAARERAYGLAVRQETVRSLGDRLAEAVAATPRPERAGATRDPCFTTFL